MWILLLDHSGSMSQPFSGKIEFAGRSRTSDAAVKLEAAKTAIAEHLLGLGSPDRIALFGFTTRTKLLFKGMSNEAAGLRAAIDPLTAGGGTDVAGALDAAAEHAIRNEDERVIQVLVISDGLSAREPAERAAQRLAQHVAVVNVILIDPTDEGEAVARAIAVRGSVQGVMTSRELSFGIERSVEGYQRAREVAELVAEVRQEAEQVIARQGPEPERLSFSVGYPEIVSASVWYPLLVYLHLARLRDEVEQALRQKSSELGLYPAISAAAALSRVSRGTWLRIVPRLDGFAFNPLSQEVAWYEDIQEVVFRLRAELRAAGRPVLGAVEVYAGPVLIAQVPLSVQVRGPGEPDEPTEPAVSSGRIFQSVFASYSHHDEWIVQACAAVYAPLGIDIYLDKRSLRSGDLWRDVLQDFIRKSDLFQLYWSQAASQSEEVEKEWRHALSLTGRKGEGFIRPLYWEDEWPRPPVELGHLHFARLDLVGLEQRSGQALARVPSSTSHSVPVTAVPVLPGIAPEALSEIREDLSTVVRFLEETTGLRYYPVPTLLVDEHLVRSVRARTTRDASDICDASNATVQRTLALTDFLNSIALDLHMRGLRPANVPADQVAERLGRGRLLEPKPYSALMAVCEGGIRAAVEPILQPSWRSARDRRFLEPPRPGFVEFILGAVEQAVDDAKNRETRYGVLVWRSPEAAFLMHDLEECGLTVVKNDEGNLSLRGHSDAFLSALWMLRTKLAETLAPFEDYDSKAPHDTVPGTERIRGIAEVLRALCSEMLPYEATGRWIGSWLLETVSPRWRSQRDELAASDLPGVSRRQDFLSFLSRLLEVIQEILEEGLRQMGDFQASGISIAESSWEWLKREIPDLSFSGTEVRRNSWREEETSVLATGSFSEVVRVFGRARIGLLDALRQLPRPNLVQRLFVVDVPTYGIYAPRDSATTDELLRSWAFERRIPVELTLPATPRVLFCLSALERFETQLRASGVEGSRRSAQDFQRCVLLHEHFHAILESGLDGSGLAATGPLHGEAWQAASPLNESLAVWMELHAARQTPQLWDLVWSYVQAGSYPEWPYRGAEHVEDLYQHHGIEEIRRLISGLRRDPTAAQAGFDSAQG